MGKEEIIRNLKYTMEKHKNDAVSTFGTNISAMCKDILDYLEQEPEIDDVLDKIKAEIEDIAFDVQDLDCDRRSCMLVDLDDTLEIIDKYKEK